jgi:hypothetical protein
MGHNESAYSLLDHTESAMLHAALDALCTQRAPMNSPMAQTATGFRRRSSRRGEAGDGFPREWF